MRGGYGTIQIGSEFWGDLSVRDALFQRDIAQLFRLVQKATGASQTKVGIATGLSQAQVSEIISGKRVVTTIDVLRRIVSGLAMPVEAMAALLMSAEVAEVDAGHVPEPGFTVLGDAPNSATGPLAATPGQRDSFGTSRSEPVDVFTSREEFTSEIPPHVLFDGATHLRAVGLSLNLLCQQYADRRLIKLVRDGAQVSCLFLQPDGQSIRAREAEEGWTAGHLSALTDLNLNAMQRIRDRLPADRRQALTIATYDETIRFNIVLVDQSVCIAQPYLPSARGVEAPTMLIRRELASGLYATFEHVFDSLWERCQEL